ncbi:MAG: DUF3830 family protein [Clostridium sp.]|nr:DUF3830 family protein [Clostridium sp.]
MIRHIQLEWKALGIKAKAKLLWDRAPHFCAELEKLLPFESIYGHTVISGHNMSIPMKLLWLEREYDAERKPGRLFIYTNGQRIVIPYDSTTEPGLVNCFAEIEEEDLPKLKEAGLECKFRFMTGDCEPRTIVVSAVKEE